jgi:alpha-L-rhamnosidase
MVVTDVRINGMKKPMGYAFSSVKVSWKVENNQDKKQKEAEIKIALDPEMREIVSQLNGELSSASQVVEISLKPRTTYYVQVRVTGSEGEEGVSNVTSFDTGKMDEPWSGKWIGPSEEDKFHPVLEKEVVLSGTVKRARLYICGLGLYEACFNDNKIGEDFLAPFFNDYNYGLQSQTYDMTEMLKKNGVLSVHLGNGWYKGRLGYEGKSEIYGNRFACIAELHVEYEDGSKEQIVTDESWKYYASDVEYSDIYDGEGINRLLYQDKENEKKTVVFIDVDSNKLTDRYSLLLKEMEDMQVKEIIQTPAGETVLDFGQNFSGYVSFKADFPKGTKIVLTHGEILQQGNFYRDNYRTAKAELHYTSDGRQEWVRPRFTYMGFRYVKVEGWPGEICKEDFIGKAVYSAMEQTGFLVTGHEKVNQLISNAIWGLKSNFLDMPTDCPQRDERLGWTGDAQVFAPTASFFMDTRAFYRKFLWDMRNDQLLRGGAIANFLPNINGETGGSSVWGDAATFIPDTLFMAYGDKEALEESYPMMKDWVEWIKRGDMNRADGPKYLFDYGFSFGDWLAMDGVTPQSFKGGTEDGYVSSIYYYASVKKLARAAEVLKKEAEVKEYEELAEKIRTAILEEYFTPSGRLAIDTQTGYIIALYFGVYRDKDAILQGLKSRLKKDAYRIKGGFVGAPLLCETLADNGMENLAYHILLQEEFPSWIHCINLGATTIWERWNSVLDDGSISGTGMNSLNHYAYGSIINYIVKNIAGLKPLESGYKKVIIQPQPDARLKFVSCEYDSVNGKYKVEWKINSDGTLSFHVEVPFDCEAVLSLPDYPEEILCQAGVHEINYSPKKDYRSLYDWNTLLEDYAKDPKTIEIIKETLPPAFGMMMSKDIENLSLTLGEMKFMPWFGFRPEDVEEAAKRLFAIQTEI